MKYDRTIKLFGQETFDKFKDVKLILFGVGGIGSFALDALYNTGITNITIVDFDTYEDSNMNRQLGSHGNIGRIKVEVLKEKYPEVTPIHVKVTPEWIDNFDFSSYDYILDAIDDIKPKVHLIKKHFTKVISTSGGAKRIDATKLEYISIWDTYNDQFIKKVRTELKNQGFKKKFKVVFSSEVPLCVEKGSFEGVTASFGLMMASVTVQKLLKKMKKAKD
ncbi:MULTISPECIES: tRNA threonylcarbamoyladenosine dehydratase [Arcobacteraceae]|jgi:tRNA A37 threonylcarbamoyladenosine dehydratase|uniref:MoeB/ThiF family protein n=6 Tax=Aliarcobacter butzleri TaxID=28197 RepID=A8ESF9_ALIB4|nr:MULTISPECIES: tRNA threonylcarbamoyladenosine dehydratase [Arcobacteraceae]MCP3648444.1 tRNA threonylcarbamoyladenosine dehydratase [Arcobacter sp. DNRA7]ABV66883.1 MoeB/ThiF family protein [Aliarcobacter butzleri RM4018]AGR76924.1 dinucleotide-utilizing enzyme, molybdopterin/thiamine biosynthesis family 1 [Aliarcobacter butzleri 7h1h]EFU70370.1 ThiF family protein [Aliarcobacter butzleri JV22]KLD96930.1 MoeB/ThiF family protein [Aliarcobacter butzleri L349]